MASTPSLDILASDWLKGCSFQISFESLMLIHSAMFQISVTGNEQGRNEHGNGNTSQVQKFHCLAAQISQRL